MIPDRINKIYLMDCVQGMRQLIDDSTVDVIVTSPPYNLGIKYSSYDDKIPREEYLSWIEKVAHESRRVLSDNGSLFLNMGYTSKDPCVAWEVAARFRKYFVLQNVIHWIKSIAISKDDVGSNVGIQSDLAVGHYKPLNSSRYLSKCHEYVFHFTKRGDIDLDKTSIGVPYQDKTNIKRWKRPEADIRDRGDTWFIPYDTICSSEEQRPHPSSFPIKLPLMCLRLHGLSKISLVLDPFIGIGSTALACVRVGLPYIGFEIDESYARVAEERIAEERMKIKANGSRFPERARHQASAQQLITPPKKGE